LARCVGCHELLSKVIGKFTELMVCDAKSTPSSAAALFRAPHRRMIYGDVTRNHCNHDLPVAGFSVRFDGYGHSYGHGGVGFIGTVLITMLRTVVA